MLSSSCTPMSHVAICDSPLHCTQQGKRDRLCLEMCRHHLPHNRLNTNYFLVLQIASIAQVLYFHALGHHPLKTMGVGVRRCVRQKTHSFSTLCELLRILDAPCAGDLLQVQQRTGFSDSQRGGTQNAPSNRTRVPHGCLLPAAIATCDTVQRSASNF